MKKYSKIIVVLCLMIQTQPLFSAFIEIYIPVRRTADSNGKIIMHKLYNSVEVQRLSEEGKWGQIKLKDGTEGWIPARFIVEQLKKDTRVVELEKKLNQSKQELSELLADVAVKGAKDVEVNRLKKELKQINFLSSNVLNIKEQNQQLIKTNQELQTLRDMLNEKVHELEDDSSHTWFVYGVGAVVLGALLALIINRMWTRRTGYLFQ